MSLITTTPQRLIAPRFLFRFSVPLGYRKKLWTDSGIALEPKYQLLPLGELDEERQIADLRMAWNEDGIGFTLRVEGKRQPPWCRDTRLEDSDGLQLWIDTRDTHTIHRASRYCHRFAFLPGGGGRKYDQPVADQLIINRARENARPVQMRELQVRGEKRTNGYVLEGFIPTVSLGGYDPAEQPRLGFTYAITDRELGVQTFSAGQGFPYQEDPSTWATLELMEL
jgi:hypothetical protein